MWWQLITADEKESAGGAGRPFKASRIVEQGRPENLELEDTPSTTPRLAGFQNQFIMLNFREDHFSRLLFGFAFELHVTRRQKLQELSDVALFWRVCRKGQSGTFSTAAFHRVPVICAAMT